MKQAKKSRGSKSSSPNSRELSKILETIRRGRSFLVTTHANPDGDALGSAIALAIGLKKLGKRAKVYNEDPVPGNLRFLPRAGSVSQKLDPSEYYDASFIVDCAEPDRVGEAFVKHPHRGQVIVIDHHRKSQRAGDLNLIQPKAASSGTVVLQVLQKLKVSLNREIALAVYTTLVTDTGNFRYSNTDASVLQLAARLVAQGVLPSSVATAVYESYPVTRLKLLGQVLPTLAISADGRYASLTLMLKMLEETGATVDLSDEFINYARSVDTVKVAIFFREKEGGGWKVSFRSKERYDVARLAARFGGGGHARAAGCKLEGSFEEVQRKIYSAVEEVLAS